MLICWNFYGCVSVLCNQRLPVMYQSVPFRRNFEFFWFAYTLVPSWSYKQKYGPNFVTCRKTLWFKNWWSFGFTFFRCWREKENSDGNTLFLFPWSFYFLLVIVFLPSILIPKVKAIRNKPHDQQTPRSTTNNRKHWILMEIDFVFQYN